MPGLPPLPVGPSLDRRRLPQRANDIDPFRELAFVEHLIGSLATATGSPPTSSLTVRLRFRGGGIPGDARGGSEAGGMVDEGVTFPELAIEYPDDVVVGMQQRLPRPLLTIRQATRVGVVFPDSNPVAHERRRRA